MFIRLNRRAAQSITEYAVLMGVVVLAIVLIQVYLKRSIQGKFKSTADEIGEQFSTGEQYSTQTIQQSNRFEETGTTAFKNASGAVGTDLITAGTAWSQSVIADTTGGSRPTLTNPAANIELNANKLSAYAGHEVTQKDYIDSSAKGANSVGAHSAFTALRTNNVNPFDEATK